MVPAFDYFRGKMAALGREYTTSRTAHYGKVRTLSVNKFGAPTVKID
jgi:hypothetical protein